MITDFSADPDLVKAFGPFYAMRAAVPTGQVLSTLAKDPRVAEFLAPYQVTFAVVIRNLADNLADEEDGAGEPGLVEVAVPSRWDEDAKIRFTTPMAAALERASTGSPLGPADLLAAILQDPDCTAVQNLTEVGVDIAELRASLEAGQPVVREDPLDPELRSTREALLGRRRYRPRELGQFWTSFFVRLFPMNPGDLPCLWARLEAGEVAQRQHGGKIRSDDLLLAILRTHAVAELYPHMVDDSKADSRAGQILTDAGLDHRTVKAAMDRTDLGQDAVPLKKQMRGHPVGTTELLRRLQAEPGNRAVRLLQELKVDPARL